PTLQNFHPCLGYQKSITWLSRRTLNFCLYKPCAMCLSWPHFHTCFVSEPNCNCCLSNKYTYMQLRSPEVTRVNFHLTQTNKINPKVKMYSQYSQRLGTTLGTN